MIVLMGRKELFAKGRAYGFQETEFIDHETGVELWEREGVFYTVPLAHKPGFYCPLEVKWFFQRSVGKKGEPLEIKSSVSGIQKTYISEEDE